MTYCIDADEIRRALELYLLPGQLSELRALNCRVQGEYRTGTLSGYFDLEHVDDLIAACQQIQSASACYFIPNPVKLALHGRAYNRARIIKDREPTTTDKDIERRRWLLIDVDPVRPSGISSTEAEKDAAHNVLLDIDYTLFHRGFPPGIIADSGNGWHLTIPIDLPTEDKGVVERLLKGLADEFNNEFAKVDTTVFNPARIWKLPGTLAAKGDHAPEIGREWRMAHIKTVCNEAPRC